MTFIPRFFKYLSLILILLSSVLTYAADVPVLTRHITDQTGTLTVAQLNHIDQKLVDLEKRKGTQLVVLIVATTAPQDLESYSLAVAETNQIGRKGTDDGVLLLVAKDDRRDRIEVGYGLEGAIPDAAAARIQRDEIESQFKTGHFFEGIDAGVDALTQLIDGEALPAPKDDATSNSDHESSSKVPMYIIMLIFGILIPASILRAIVARFIGRSTPFIRRISVGAGIMSVFGLFTDGSFIGMLISAAMGALFLAKPFAEKADRQRSYRHRMAFSSSESSISSGSDSSGSSNDNGFSGGGGNFGGGGSSGKW